MNVSEESAGRHHRPRLTPGPRADGTNRRMDVSDHLKRRGAARRQVVFDGEPFTAPSVARLRDGLFPELMGLK